MLATLHPRCVSRARSGVTLSLAAAIAGIALLSAPATASAQQEGLAPPAKLMVTTSSEAARTAFWNGVREADNIDFARAHRAFESAVKSDPGFGLARVLAAFWEPGATRAQRVAAIDKAIGSLGQASTVEVLTAAGHRELAAGNTAEAHKILATASQLAPGDAHLAYRAAVTTPNTDTKSVLAVTEKFPKYGPAYNILAYRLWAANDRPGAMKAVKTYAELEPNHPNPHDSYAELLQRSGEFAQAAMHYKRAIELQPTYAAGYDGIAETAVLLGNTAEARSALERSLPHRVTPQQRLTTWRRIAATYVIDGNKKAALETYAKVATEAEKEGLKGIAALAHQQAALTEAAIGSAKAAPAHLAAAAALDGADTPAQLATTGLAMAMAKKLPDARAAMTKLEASTDYDNWKTPAISIKAMTLLHENKADMALAELAKADQSDILVKAIKAECLAKTKQKTEAQALRQEVMKDGNLNLADPATPIAWSMARKR